MILLIDNFKPLHQSLFVFRLGAAEWLPYQTTAAITAGYERKVNTWVRLNTNRTDYIIPLAY